MVLETRVGALVEPIGGKRWDSDEIRMRVRSRANDYQRAGFKQGERVFVHFGNCNEFFVELLAAWQVGGCVIPVDTNFTAFEIETLASWARPRLSVWNGEPAREASAALSQLGVEVVDLTAIQRPPGTDDAVQARFRLDDDALILFTSGTTGEPKGVVHTHRSLRARWISLRSELGLAPYRRTLCLLPTHFGHGLICNCLFPWLSGCELFILPPFRPDLISRLGSILDEHDITFMSSVPTVWRLAQRISRRPQAGSLERVFVGSAPLTAQLWMTVQEWSGASEVFNAYGITETGSWLGGTTVEGFVPEDGLVGEAWGGVVRVLRSGDPGSPSDPESVCGSGESGYVWVNTPALMRGYLDRDDLTEAVVSGGWFMTGDIGLVDERGWLYLRGRERDEINKGGLKVYPSDVDAVIERFPSTVDVCTFAFSEPTLGEDVGVAVVLDEDAPETLLALHRWTTTHLARHQVPQRWYVLPEIPRTSRGKVSRQAVGERCAGETPRDIGRLRIQGSESATNS